MGKHEDSEEEPACEDSFCDVIANQLDRRLRTGSQTLVRFNAAARNLLRHA